MMMVEVEAVEGNQTAVEVDESWPTCTPVESQHQLIDWDIIDWSPLVIHMSSHRDYQGAQCSCHVVLGTTLFIPL